MPTYKHPCPHCGGFIARDVVACPYCGTRDPFVAGRCASCRAPIDDSGWAVCPKCGASLRPDPAVGAMATGPAAGAATAVPAPVAAPPSPAAAEGTAPAAAPPSETGGRCAGCGGPLAAGATFCPACGTLVG